MGKTRLSLLLAFVIILLLPLRTAADCGCAAPEGYAVERVTAHTEQRTLSASVTAAEPCSLAVALYDRAGNQLSCVFLPVEGTGEYAAPLPPENSGLQAAATGRAFLLGDGSWVPLCPPFDGVELSPVEIPNYPLRMDTVQLTNASGETYTHILDTFSGTASLTFNEALYGLDESASPPKLKQLDRGPASSPDRDNSRFLSIETMVQFRSSSAVEVVTEDRLVNQPTQVIALRFTHARDGTFLTFASDLSDQFGNVHNTPLTVSVEVEKVKTMDHIDPATGEVVYELVSTPLLRVKPDEWDPSGRTRGNQM